MSSICNYSGVCGPKQKGLDLNVIVDSHVAKVTLDVQHIWILIQPGSNFDGGEPVNIRVRNQSPSDDSILLFLRYS
jgi:hypothetical protein